MMELNPVVDTEHLKREFEELAGFSDAEPPAVTRVVFTETDLRARQFLKESCAHAGLLVREDALGNTFARWEGTNPALPAVGTGSHMDAIPHSGRFDGTVGVLGGLEALRALRETGFQPTRSLELLIFTSEEPTRFGLGCLSSRALSGAADLGALDRMVDKEGRSLEKCTAPASPARSVQSRCRIRIIRHLSSCTSNRVHCSSETACLSARHGHCRAGRDA